MPSTKANDLADHDSRRGLALARRLKRGLSLPGAILGAVPQLDAVVEVSIEFEVNREGDNSAVEVDTVLELTLHVPPVGGVVRVKAFEAGDDNGQGRQVREGNPEALLCVSWDFLDGPVLQLDVKGCDGALRVARQGIDEFCEGGRADQFVRDGVSRHPPTPFGLHGLTPCGWASDEATSAGSEDVRYYTSLLTASQTLYSENLIYVVLWLLWVPW